MFQWATEAKQSLRTSCGVCDNALSSVYWLRRARGMRANITPQGGAKWRLSKKNA